VAALTWALAPVAVLAGERVGVELSDVSASPRPLHPHLEDRPRSQRNFWAWARPAPSCRSSRRPTGQPIRLRPKSWGAEFNLITQKPKKDKFRDLRRLEEELSHLLLAGV